jgi:hypothetical protein
MNSEEKMFIYKAPCFISETTACISIKFGVELYNKSVKQI